MQTNRYRSPLHRGESLDISPEDAERMLLEEGEIVRVSSRRGSVETPVHIDPSLRPGLTFMTFHFPDQVDTNLLTIDVTDPKSGTAEFKACAVRVDKLDDARARRRARSSPSPRRSPETDGHPPPRCRTDRRRARGGRARPRPAVGRLGRRRRATPTGRATRCAAAATRRARAGTCCCPCCSSVQEHVGWISPGALNHIAERLTVPPADVYGVATFYALLSVEPRPPRVVHVCEDLACRCNGSQELIAQLEEHLGAEGELNADGSGTWLRSPCLGQCDRAPAAMVTLAGEHPEEHVLAPVDAQRGAGGDRRPSRSTTPIP